MNHTLRFEDLSVLLADLGEESGTPDILSGINLQNRTKFDLDEIFKDSVSGLWKELTAAVYGSERQVPDNYRFGEL